MASISPLASRASRAMLVAALPLIAAAILAASGSSPTGGISTAVTRAVAARIAAALPVPATFAAARLGLRDGPAPAPLELLMPSLGVRAAVTGVGLTPQNVMDAPMGAADDPVWQQAFWYRGSALPGAVSTALIAGHIDDSLGRPAVFAHIDNLRPADPIIIRDTRSGLEVRFSVTDAKTFSLDQATDRAVLTEMYGAGPVAGTGPQPSPDGLSHMTLVTCAGTFRNGTHDHRLVVYATRVG
ncbi:MAG: class F sortase [Acidimicrobiales bacterium]